jgi:hypothetical protein
MKQIILDTAADAGLAFADYARKEDEALDQDTLRDALHTGHVSPDEIAETFITSVLENLGLENDLLQRREDKVEKVLKVLGPFLVAFSMPPIMKEVGREVAEKIVDALYKKPVDTGA